MKKPNVVYDYTAPAIARREQDFCMVQDILDGKKELWTPLYESAYSTVFRRAAQADTQKLLSTQDYHDIAQDAFTLCYTHLERFRGESCFARWVSGYARNITRNRCAREQTRLRNQTLLESAARSRMHGCDPLLILIRLEREACFWEAFSTLNATDRAILIGRVLEQNKPRTIAGRLKLSRKDVIRRYDNAKYALRRLFARSYAYPKAEDLVNKLRTIQRRLYEQSV